MKDNRRKELSVFTALFLFVIVNTSSQEISVKVFSEIQLQKIKSIGANYCQVRLTNDAMKYTQAEVTMYWTWQNNYPIMSPDLKTLYPSFYATRHFTDYLNTGTRIVHSISSDPEVMVLSGIHQDGSKVIQLINNKKEPVKINIQGFNSTSAEVITTSTGNKWEKSMAASKNESLSVTLKAESINTLLLQ